MFANEVAILDCAGPGASCTVVATPDLDAPAFSPATALATPYGVAVSDDGATVVATAAGTGRLFTMDSSGNVLARLDVREIPKGVALRSDAASGAAQTAYVLNSLGNTVSVVDVTLPAAPAMIATIVVGADQTPDAVRRGAIAFNDAFASSTGTFSCASCHPDGNTDQLLWRIGGECSLPGCVPFEDEPRTTMPIRGLRDAVPLHWDGTLGDPFGGGNGAVGDTGSGGTDCTPSDPHGCFSDLVGAALAGVMCAQVDLGGDGNPRECATGPSGLPGLLSEQEREDMATFLERVSYPPARSRRVDDTVSSQGDPLPPTVGSIEVGGVEGFEDFFMNEFADPASCADSDAGCHELPLGTATNSETLRGFEAPTLRGLTDRFLQFSLGPTNAEEVLVFSNTGLFSPLEGPIQWDPAKGFQEITTFGAAFTIFEAVYGVRPLDIFQMFEEASTGHSGAIGRQVTLNSRTTGAALLAPTEALLSELEAADERGVVNLRGGGIRSGAAVAISYLQATDQYQVGNARLTHAQLIAEAQAATFFATLTAHLRSSTSEATPQPLLAPVGANCDTGENIPDPVLPSGPSFQLESKYVTASDVVFLDGQPVPGATISVLGAATSCAPQDGRIGTHLIQLSGVPGSGTRLLQVRNASGLLSNEVPLP
jgi:hypothetical protein